MGKETRNWKLHVVMFLVVFGVIVVSGCAIEQSVIPYDEVNVSEFAEEKSGERYCEKDTDCVIVRGGCCDCTNLGKLKAINQEYQESWDLNLSQACKGISCLEAISQHISCFSEPKCIDHACELIPEKDSLCDSLLHRACKHTLKDQLDVVYRDGGIRCREVIELCD